MKLSIVIPSYNSQDNLEKNLIALKDQINDLETEVIVVDCSSHDKVDKICFQYDFVRFIKIKERFNPGKGRNIGANVAKGQYLVFSDSDVVLEKNSITNIIKHVSQGYKIFGGALELDKKRSEPNLSSYIEHYYFNHESQASRKPQKRSNLSSALMIVERELFLSINGFSDIPRMQDTELTERMRSLGYDLYFFPDVIGYQIQDSPINKVLSKIFITGNNLYFLRYKKKNYNIMKVIFTILLPIMMLYKITRINLRNMKYSKSYLMFFILCPLMYGCGLVWMLGFYKGLFFSKGITSGR